MLFLSLTSFGSTLIVGCLFDIIGRKIMLFITCMYGYYLDGASGIILLIISNIDL